MSGEFSCFGLSVLGTCLYNPAQPSPTYFTVGDAIAALGFTLAIQQLFRPIYRFRLRAYGLKVVYLSGVVFAGVLCTMIALVLPNLPISHATLFEYPISWELLGGLLIAAAYGVTAFISLRPASINRFNLVAFVRAASALLSSANDDDRVAFAEDFLAEDGIGVRNIRRLASYASALERANRYALFTRSERRQSEGGPVLIRGRPMVSAFYEFAHRRELEAARFAVTFLRILSDPDFCSALVRKCAWRTAAILEAIAKGNIDIDQASPFIQEIAHQAILNEESMIAKEVSYTGFGTVPLLSNSLFGNWFILSQYDPMGGIGFRAPDNLSAGFVARLNGASKLMLETAIKNGDYWPSRYMYSVQQIYESLSRQWGYARSSASVGYRVTFHRGISELCRSVAEDLSTMKWEIKKTLFVKDPKSNRGDLVGVIASVVYEALANVSNWI